MICAVVLGCMALTAHAQKPAGTTTIYPRVGFNESKFGNDKIYYDSSMDDNIANAKYKAGLTVGVEVQHQITDAFAVSGGVLYSRQGTSFEKIHNMETLSITLDNINVPLLLVATTRLGLDVKVGIQPEVRVSNKFNLVMNRMNLSIPIGLSYEYKHVAIDLRYNMGMTYVYDGGTENARSKSIVVTLGYAIDL